MDQILLSDGQTLFDPEQWLPKKQAAQYAGKTERTVERWAEKDRVKTLLLRRDAQHPQAVFLKSDLDKVLKEDENKPTPALRQPAPAPRQTDMAVMNGHAVSSVNPYFPTTPTATTIVTPEMSGASALAIATVLFEKGTYLSMKEARELTRWSKSALEEAVKEGRVRRAPGRAWLLRTIDLLML